jgi:ATF/CREB family transcription factor
MAPGTRSSKEAHATKASTSAAAASENTTQSTSEDVKPLTNKAENKENTTQPLGPPPRPQQNDGGDYFNQSHAAANNPAYQAEPNPFEAQFGNSSADTPGKLLPSVAQLTSPSSLLPNDTPGWSLRSGPLSPAMLTGPTGGGGDYFDQQYPRGFPTPNESNMRTGLTPGGGGSMFPAPSPSGMFGGMNMGAPTPNTIDFFKTNANTRAAGASATSNGPTSQPLDQVSHSMDLKMPAAQATDNYAQHDADAANGLFMLAQSNGSRPGNQFAIPTTLAGGPVQSTDAIDNVRSSRSQKNAVNNSAIHDEDDDSDGSEEVVKPATRSRGKRTSEASRPNNRRKATDSGSKPNKRQKAMEKDIDMDMDDDDDDMSHPKDGKKMTDEEKRKNFLERNRVAALKCRQRKKQWLQNLQSKVDLYSQENDALTHTVNVMREYIGQLRQILLQHKDCPVTMQQAMGQQQLMGFLAQDSMMFMPPVNGVGQQMQMAMMGDGRGQPNGNGMGRS